MPATPPCRVYGVGLDEGQLDRIQIPAIQRDAGCLDARRQRLRVDQRPFLRRQRLWI